MRVSANNRRSAGYVFTAVRVSVVSFLLVGVSGCAMNQSDSGAPSGEMDAGQMAAAEPDSAEGLARPSQPVLADNIREHLRARGDSAVVLLDSGDAPLSVEVIDSASATRVLLETDEAAPLFNISELSDPRRLVLDFPRLNARINKAYELDGSQFLTRVRLGAHEDKERVVLDLAGNSDVQHQVDVIDGVLVLTLSNELRSASADLSDFLVARSSIPAADKSEEIMAAPQIEMLPGSDNQIAKKAEDTTPHLTGIKFEQTGPGKNRVIAEVTSAGVFNLKKTAASEFVLTLEDATLDENATQAIVAPPASGLIRSVRPVQQGGDVLVRIFAAPNTDLKATAGGGQITINASQLDEGGPLAQLKDEKKDEKKAEVTTSDAEPANSTEDELSSLLEGDSTYTGRLISLDLQDTDIDNALRIIAEVSNLNIIASDDVTGKVTLRLIDVPWDQALDVILKTNGLDKVQEGNVIRVAPVDKLRAEREALKEAKRAEDDLAPLLVRYVRISYSKASDLKPLAETVLTERGSVGVDERTNQIIIKDIQKGIANVVEMVKRLDLRTPQVLLETQIVEAQRNFLRDLGTELGWSYIQSPETGNALPNNFPNSVVIGGSVNDTGDVLTSFPAALGDAGGSAMSILFGSADGTRNLSARVTALESEGRIRVVSRPSVATINNKQAIIKSVEKIRVRTPDSGLSVATGQGATASGGATTATETFEVGITLEVTPQASPDYYVLLDINAKSSTLGATVVDGIPSEVERSATSTVLVSSGQTFALGGIYKITDQDTVDGVPFFKDIPVFGALFRRQAVDNGDEELIFFITPRIVEGSFDDAAMRSNG